VSLSRRLGLVQQAVDDVRTGVQRVRDRLAELSEVDAVALAEAATVLVDRLGGAVDLDRARGYAREVSGLSSSYDAPTEAQRLEIGRLAEVVAALESDLNVFLIGDGARFRDQVLAVNLEVFPLPRLVGS